MFVKEVLGSSLNSVLSLLYVLAFFFILGWLLTPPNRCKSNIPQRFYWSN